MKTNALISKTWIIVFLLITMFNYSCSGNESISGTVIDSYTNQPIHGASVSVQKKTTTLSTSKTDSNGNFFFYDLKEGIYSLTIKAPNYTEKTIPNVIVKTNQTNSLNISLQAVQAPVIKEDVILEELVEMDIELAQPAPIKISQEYAPMMKREHKRAAGSYTAYEAEPYNNFNTESYDVINENTFKEVMNEPLSTFSIDVDRASYSNVRRMLNYSQLPHKDMVRIEEMVNYFDYNYPQPKDEKPFSTIMEYGECPWNSDHQLALIGIKGKELKSSEIPPSNLVFLIDVSGSMSDANKLPLLKKSFEILIQKLRPTDKVAIVVYAGAAGEVLPATSGNNKKKILDALNNLQAGGSTAGGAGIELAYNIAKQNFISEGNNRVILATDGDFNVGASSNAEMVRLIEKKRDDGIYLTILGFGMGNYKDSKMEQLSNAGNGNYAYIDNIMEANKVFGNELWGTLFTIAKDVKIQIEFNPTKVKAYRLIGYENRLLNNEDFNDDKKDAGEIGCGHTVTALYEIIPADSKETVNKVDALEYQRTNVVSSNNLMTLKLRYKQPDENKSNLIVHRIEEKAIDQVTNNFFFAASVAEFGMLLRNSEFKKEATFDQVISLASQSKGTDKYGYKAEFIKLVQTAKLLSPVTN